MTKDFCDLIALSATSVFTTSETPTLSTCDWDKLSRLAQEQSISTLFFCAMRNCKYCPQEYRDVFIAKTRSGAIQNFLRKCSQIELLHEAEAVGLHAKVIKGFSVGECYAIPEARQSGDMDVYIAPQTEKQFLQFLEAKGFYVEHREMGSHHTVCMHQQYGLLEVHIDLFSEYAKHVWLDSVNFSEWFDLKKTYMVKSKEGVYDTLAPTEHFAFLFLHMLNHFVNMGTGLKMLFDIVAYYDKYHSEIDQIKLMKVINASRGGCLLSCVFAILKEYGGYTGAVPNIAPPEKELYDRILDDIERGGSMGVNEPIVRQIERNVASRSQMISKGSILSFVRHKGVHYCIRLRQYFLPTWNELCLVNPELRTHPFYYPRIWFENIRKCYKAFVQRRSKVQAIIPNGNRRELLIDCGVMVSDIEEASHRWLLQRAKHDKKKRSDQDSAAK